MGVINRGYEQGRFVDVAGGGVARMRRSQNNLAGKHSVLRELGIGTNDPEKSMHILSEQSGGALMVERIQTNANPAAVILRKSRGDLDAKVVIADDDNLGDFLVEGYVGANNGYQTLGDFRFEVDGSVTDAASGAPVRMVMKLASGSGLVERLRLDSSGNMGIGMNDPSTKLTVEGAVTLKEQSSADSDVAAYGQLWVKTATPNELYFTTDAGNDIQITSGTSMAGGGGSGDITGVTIQTDSGSGSKATDTSGSADFILQGDSAGIDVTNSGTTITVALDLNEITAGAVADGDSFVFVDANDSNANKKEAIADLATLFAGDGLTASSSVLAVNVDDSTIETNSDAIRIKDDGVTYAKIQNVSATDRILGRDSSGAGVIEEITPANLRTMLNVADGATAGGEANEYSFKTISVSGQDNVVADTTTDTLTFAAGSNVTITTTAASDTVTIASADTNTTYSAGTLLDLSTTTFNVDLTEASEQAIANGDYILFLDGGATGSHAKENIADVATLFAGDGLTASSAVMAVNVDDSTIETSSDAIRIKDNGVTLAKMAGLARGKIIHGDSSGDPAALALGSANTVLQSDGTDSSWGTVATAMIADNAVSLAKMAGLARGSIIYGDASGDPAALSVGSNTYVLTSDGTDIAWASAGGGSARSVAGDTDNAVMSWVTSDNTFAAEANLTFDGNSLLCVTGSASAVPCTIKGAGSQSVDLVQCQDSSGDNLLMIDQGGSIRLGLGGDREIHVEPESGTNSAGKDIFIKGGKSTGNGEGGDIRFYTSPVGSSGSSVNGWAEVLKIRHDKILDFKLAAETDSGTDYQYASKVLEVKVAGSQYFLPLYEETGGGGGGGGGGGP